MARLKDLIPPGEIVRWTSLQPVPVGRLVGWGVAFSVLSGSALLLAARSYETGAFLLVALVVAAAGVLTLKDQLSPDGMEAAVTDGHVVWDDGAWLFGRDSGSVALRDIRAVEVEEGGVVVNLDCAGGRHRLEELRGDNVEGMVAAIGAPASIWRECKSAAAMRARRWRNYADVFVTALVLVPFSGLMIVLLRDDSYWWYAKAAGILAAALPLRWFIGMAARALPHLLVGRRLTGEARRDFVGWMTDLRWRGVKADGAEDERLPRSRLEGWAMRVAYGGIPDIGAREPEILIPGAFPPDPDGAETR